MGLDKSRVARCRAIMLAAGGVFVSCAAFAQTAVSSTSATALAAMASSAISATSATATSATAAAAGGSSAGYTFTSLLMLGLLAALVAVLAWLMRRGVASGARGGSPIRVVAAQALGQRERVVVVNVGSRSFLLGHTSSQVNLLAELAPDEVPVPHNRLPDNLFADLLKKLKK